MEREVKQPLKTCLVLSALMIPPWGIVSSCSLNSFCSNEYLYVTYLVAGDPSSKYDLNDFPQTQEN